MLLKAAAGTIKVQYNAHATGLDRQVSNILVSNLQPSVNRSMDDPLLLAHELGRQGLTEAKDIRNVMKLYNGMVLSSEPGMWGIQAPWHVEHEYQKKREENEKKYNEMLQKKKVLTRLRRSFGKLGNWIRQKYLREGRRRRRHLLEILRM